MPKKRGNPLSNWAGSRILGQALLAVTGLLIGIFPYSYGASSKLGPAANRLCYFIVASRDIDRRTQGAPARLMESSIWLAINDTSHKVYMEDGLIIGNWPFDIGFVSLPWKLSAWENSRSASIRLGRLGEPHHPIINSAADFILLVSQLIRGRVPDWRKVGEYIEGHGVAGVFQHSFNYKPLLIHGSQQNSWNVKFCRYASGSKSDPWALSLPGYVSLFLHFSIRSIGKSGGDTNSDECQQCEPKRSPLKATGFLLSGLVLLYYFFRNLYFRPDDRGWLWFCGTLVGLGLFCYGFNMFL